MMPYLTSAYGAFKLLVRDYEEALEYVHPCDSNANTYSHRLYELLLRSYTEFESLAKGAAFKRNLIPSNNQTKINELSRLTQSLDLDPIEVGVPAWGPQEYIISPLSGWAKKPHELYWYRAYNDVKHQRAVRFPEAK